MQAGDRHTQIQGVVRLATGGAVPRAHPGVGGHASSLALSRASDCGRGLPNGIRRDTGGVPGLTRFMYIFVYMCVCVCIHTQIHIYIYIYIDR